VPPVDVGEQVLHVDAAQEHMCAVTASGKIHCRGQGPGLGVDRTKPYQHAVTAVAAPFRRVRLEHTNRVALLAEVDVGGPAEVVVPSTSLAWSARTCARLRDGTVRCWGLTDHWDDAAGWDV